MYTAFSGGGRGQQRAVKRGSWLRPSCPDATRSAWWPPMNTGWFLVENHPAVNYLKAHSIVCISWVGYSWSAWPCTQSCRVQAVRISGFRSYFGLKRRWGRRFPQFGTPLQRGSDSDKNRSFSWLPHVYNIPSQFTAYGHLLPVGEYIWKNSRTPTFFHHALLGNADMLQHYSIRLINILCTHNFHLSFGL